MFSITEVNQWFSMQYKKLFVLFFKFTSSGTLGIKKEERINNLKN